MRTPFILLPLPGATPADTERLQRIGDIALAYAERTGKISPQDAADARAPRNSHQFWLSLAGSNPWDTPESRVQRSEEFTPP